MIGSSKLEHRDLFMGVVHGSFTPGSEYDAVKSVFKLFTDDKHDEYYTKRDGLKLTLKDDSGQKIRTGFIHIEDYLSEYNEIRVEIGLINPEPWPDDEVA